MDILPQDNAPDKQSANSKGVKWLPIAGYEATHEVSNFGEVRSLDCIVERLVQGNLRKKGRILKPHRTPKGYLRIQICRDANQHNFMVHRLVAEAFIPNPDNLPEVNHRNGIKSDNRVGNLEWSSSSDNQKHAYKTGLRKPVTKYIVHCRELNITTMGTNKMAIALRKHGYVDANAGAIWNCMSGATKNHLGLTFVATRVP